MASQRSLVEDLKSKVKTLRKTESEPLELAQRVPEIHSTVADPIVFGSTGVEQRIPMIMDQDGPRQLGPDAELYLSPVSPE